MNRNHGLAAALAVALVASLAGCSSDAEKQCSDFCGAGSACVGGACVAITCAPACAAGQFCQMGACVDVDTVTCSGAAAPCQVCDTSGAAPAWVDVCGVGSVCDATANRCVLTSQKIHAEIAGLDGPFTSGYAVTAKCVGCHPRQAADLMRTAHWSWRGTTPGLVDAALADPSGIDPSTATSFDAVAKYGTLVGKANLVNNFCVSVAGNEGRCDQCHAGYGGDPNPAHVQKSARAYAGVDPSSANTALSSIPLENRVDCLVCHADLTRSKYVKGATTFGNADVKQAAGCAPMSAVPGVEGCASTHSCLLDPDGAPSCYAVSGDYYKGKRNAALAAATQTIKMPDRENCGFCHFFAGGGDSVKLMGGSLRAPSRNVDAHMGGGMTCSDCHAQPGHAFSGAGVHVPAFTSRSACEDCHGAAPHPAASGTMNDHVAKLACQTCHIPRFSRGQFSKTDWDWSTTGQKDRGIVKATLVDATGLATVTSTVERYSYIKGDFVWQANVKPAYAWYDGRMAHATTMDRADFDALGTTTVDSSRITLGAPVGRKCSPGSRIHPFKLMRGKQAVYVDPASTPADARDFVVNPKVFGPGSLWGVIQGATWTSASYATPGAMDALWSTVLTSGARAAGQIGPGASIAKAAGGAAGWEFRYTKLYMDLNHEVAPKEQAVGAGGNCGACHGTATPAIPFDELGYTVPLGYSHSCP